jgi:hypothetical protein
VSDNGSNDGTQQECERLSRANQLVRYMRHGTLERADIKRLRGLENENAKLKRIVAERDLEIDTL